MLSIPRFEYMLVGWILVPKDARVFIPGPYEHQLIWQKGLGRYDGGS